MTKLGIIILAKNEERQISAALKSASFADEMIVLDTGSTDTTIDIVKKYPAKIFCVKFTDFSSLRNFGKSKSNSDWIFYLDADEEIPSALKKEIQEIINSNNSLAGYFVRRKNYYLGKEWPLGDRMQRLFKKDKLVEWYGKVHETAKVNGEVGEMNNYLSHHTHNNLEEMLTNTLVWSDFEANERFKIKHPAVVWWRIVRVMLTSFCNSYIMQKGYRAGTAGLIESIYQSFSIFVTYAKLWEMQKKSYGK